MQWLSLASGGFDLYSKTNKHEAFLAEMDRVLPWDQLDELIERHYPDAVAVVTWWAWRACCASTSCSTGST